MKKYIAVLLILTAVLFCSCSHTTIPVVTEPSVSSDDGSVSGVSLNITKYTINQGGILALTAIVTPLTAKDPSVVWSSSDESIATVSAKGRVTAVSAGSAVITASSAGGNKAAQCDLTVLPVGEQIINVTSVVIDYYITGGNVQHNVDQDPKVENQISGGRNYEMHATVYPENATNKEVTWEITNPKVSSITADGVLSATGAGRTSVQVTTADGAKTAKCLFIISALRASSMALDKNEITLPVGGADTLNAVFTPSNATDQGVKWTSDNNSVAIVSPEGVVTAYSVGTALITATAKVGGLTASCTVTVTGDPAIHVTGVSLNPTNAEMNIGETLSLNAAVAPENASNKNVTWSSSNEDAATVKNGVVTAVGAGNAVIAVTSIDGGFHSECSITVIGNAVHVTGISLNTSSATLSINDTLQPTVTFSPENATDKGISWSSSNQSVATVENGIIKAVGAGEAVITATSVDGGRVANCVVTVTG